MRQWRAGALFWTRLTTISAIACTLRANYFEHGANTQSHQPSTTSGVLQLPSRQSSRIVPPALVCGHMYTRNRSQANGKIQIRCRRSFLNAPLRRQSSGAFKYLFYTRPANSPCSCTLSHNKVETTTAIHCWSRPEEGRLEPNPTRAICPGIQGFSQITG